MRSACESLDKVWPLHVGQPLSADLWQHPAKWRGRSQPTTAGLDAAAKADSRDRRYSMCDRKGCTSTSLNTELPMVSVGEGFQPYLEDEDSVATSFSCKKHMSLDSLHAGRKWEVHSFPQRDDQHGHWPIATLWLASNCFVCGVFLCVWCGWLVVFFLLLFVVFCCCCVFFVFVFNGCHIPEHLRSHVFLCTPASFVSIRMMATWMHFLEVPCGCPGPLAVLTVKKNKQFSKISFCLYKILTLTCYLHVT